MQVTVEIPQLRELIVRRLGQKFPESDAEMMADSILFGELVGRPSHGISRILPGTYGPMDEEASGPPRVERLTSASARIRGTPGILVASLGTRLVAELASERGLAVVVTTGSHSTSGSLTYYVEQLTNQDMVGLVATNTVSYVVPEGGKGRILGTNPVAVGIPAAGYPFILDMATSAITGGEVLTAARADEQLPHGVAVDAEGEATTSPQDVASGGALLPFGGHKGLALSMMIQLLCGVFGGSGTLPLGAEDDWSHVFLAISLSALGDPEEMRQTAKELLDHITEIETTGQTEIRVPGHRSLSRRDAALARGTVDVDRDILETLQLHINVGS